MSDKAAPVAVDGELALEVQAGLGFNAAIDGERLAIVQDSDNVTLSKSEAYVLFAKFAEWAGFKVAA